MCCFKGLGLFKSYFVTYNITMYEKIPTAVSTRETKQATSCGECHAAVTGDSVWCQCCGEPNAACFDAFDPLREMPSPQVVENEIVFPRQTRVAV